MNLSHFLLCTMMGISVISENGVIVSGSGLIMQSILLQACNETMSLVVDPRPHLLSLRHLPVKPDVDREIPQQRLHRAVR